MQFGTGAVKVTPGHDIDDHAIACRHSLRTYSLFDEAGQLQLNGSPFEGLPRFAVREAVMNELGRRGLLRAVEDHSMTLPICSRTGDVLEPLLKAQWFVRCRDMADRALQAIEDGDLHLVPQIHENKLRSWLTDISDWCLSRQIWWGHRIPAYQLIPLQHSPCSK
uniref:valine--tRNA ligase-like n=1 Tax=Myxine glutinosa TaxID=7769 RepID=UPI00358E2907